MITKTEIWGLKRLFVVVKKRLGIELVTYIDFLLRGREENGLKPSLES